MLVTEIPTSSFHADLPLYVPQVPYPVTHRWVADTPPDGSVASLADVYGGVVASQATGANQPVAGTYDGLRGLDFDGVNDQLTTDDNLSAVTSFTLYAVIKPSVIPVANRIILGAGGVYMGITNAAKLGLIGSAGTFLLGASSVVAGSWYVAALGATVGSAGAAVGRFASSLDLAATNSSLTYGALGSLTIAGASTAYFDGVIRDVSIAIGTMHSEAQMNANVAALEAEYGI